MKGQTFLIIAIIFIIILALIKVSISFLEIKQDESPFLEFENVKEEMIRSVEFSINQKDNITKNLESFADFARKSFKRRASTLNLLLLQIFEENSNLNVSVKNLLGSDIIFLNITLDNSFNEFEKVRDGEKVNTIFTVPIENKNYALKIFYETSYSKEEEEFLIKPVEGKTQFVVFLDIILEIEKTKLRDKILKYYELA